MPTQKAHTIVLSPTVSLQLSGLGHRFWRRTIFENVSEVVKTGEMLIVSGANGSGKSTLMRVIAGLLRPSCGTVSISTGTTSFTSLERRAWIGYAAPDLALYANLTGVENMEFLGGLRGITLTKEILAHSLTSVGLLGRGRDLVGTYSSGMRQRLKLAISTLGDPPIWLLDEPTANLDEAGIALVEQLIYDKRERTLLVVATNEPRELKWSDKRLHLGIKE